MPATWRNWKIGGVHPAEYAARWGDGQTADGALFYNCSDMASREDRVIGNPEWTREDWTEFGAAVERQRVEVAEAIATPEGRERTGWTEQDAADLLRLGEWASYMAHRAGSTHPWVNR